MVQAPARPHVGMDAYARGGGRLAMELREQHVRIVVSEEPATTDRWKLAGIAKDQDRNAERLEIATELLIHHTALIDDEQFDLLHLELRPACELGVSSLLILLEFVDNRVDSYGARASVLPHDHGGFAGERDRKSTRLNYRNSYET